MVLARTEGQAGEVVRRCHEKMFEVRCRASEGALRLYNLVMNHLEAISHLFFEAGNSFYTL